MRENIRFGLSLFFKSQYYANDTTRFENPAQEQVQTAPQETLQSGQASVLCGVAFDFLFVRDPTPDVERCLMVQITFLTYNTWFWVMGEPEAPRGDPSRHRERNKKPYRERPGI